MWRLQTLDDVARRSNSALGNAQLSRQSADMHDSYKRTHISATR